MVLDVYRGLTPTFQITPESGSALKQRLQGEDYLDISFITDDTIAFALFDYIDYNSVKYYLFKFPEIRKIAGNLFEYHCLFEAFWYRMANVAFLQGTSDPYQNEPEFDAVGTLAVFQDLLVQNMYRYWGSVTAGDCPDTAVKTIHFSSMNCLEALRDICNQFRVEYVITEPVGLVGYKINFYDREDTPPSSSGISFSYDPLWKVNASDAGLRAISREIVTTESMGTKLYGWGSNRNIPSDYRAGVDGIGLKRLTFNPGYIQKNDGTYGTFERIVIFEEIYPRLTHVGDTHTPKWNAQVDSAGVDTSGTGDWWIISADITFAMWSYIQVGEPAQIAFTSGDCAGFTFELAYYNHSGHIAYFRFYKEGDLQYPNTDTHPHAGDEFVLLGIVMPQAYIDDAEVELAAATTREIEKYCYPMVKYLLDLDWQYIKTNTVSPVLGETIEIVDADFGLNDEIRVMALEQSLTNPYDYKLELSEYLQKSLVKEIITDIRRLMIRKVEKQRNMKIEGGSHWARDMVLGQLNPLVPSDHVLIDGDLILKNKTTPAQPVADYCKIYTKADHLPYVLNEHNAEIRIGGVQEIAFEYRDIMQGVAQTYTLDPKARGPYTVLSAVLETDTGQLTGVAIKINSTAITGLEAINVTSTQSDTAATALNSVVLNDRLKLVTTASYTGLPTTLIGAITIQWV